MEEYTAHDSYKAKISRDHEERIETLEKSLTKVHEQLEVLTELVLKLARQTSWPF